MPGAHPTISVVICDDNPRVRLTLGRIVSSQRDFAVLASVASGEAALDALASLSADVVVLDVHMPGMCGVDVARRLRTLGYPAAIVLLSADDRAATAASALDRCVFVSKGRAGAHQLVAAVRRSVAAS